MSRLLAAALALVMLGPGAFGAMLHLCKMRGNVEISACCCHDGHGKHGHRPPSCPSIKADHSDCCSTIGRSEQPVFVERTAPQLDAPPVVAALPPTEIPTPNGWSADGPAHRSRASPRAIGPPIFIRNCSYLI